MNWWKIRISQLENTVSLSYYVHLPEVDSGLIHSLSYLRKTVLKEKTNSACNSDVWISFLETTYILFRDPHRRTILFSQRHSEVKLPCFSFMLTQQMHGSEQSETTSLVYAKTLQFYPVCFKPLRVNVNVVVQDKSWDWKVIPHFVILRTHIYCKLSYKEHLWSVYITDTRKITSPSICISRHLWVVNLEFLSAKKFFNCYTV